MDFTILDLKIYDKAIVTKQHDIGIKTDNVLEKRAYLPLYYLKPFNSWQRCQSRCFRDDCLTSGTQKTVFSQVKTGNRVSLILTKVSSKLIRDLGARPEA